MNPTNTLFPHVHLNNPTVLSKVDVTRIKGNHGHKGSGNKNFDGSERTRVCFAVLGFL